MTHYRDPRISSTRLAARQQREITRFLPDREKPRQLSERSHAHWLLGVPLHWMDGWQTPQTLYIEQASGATLLDVDGRALSRLLPR